MKQFSCGDVVPGCTKVLRAESEEEIMKAVAEHARQDHGLIEVPPQVVAAVRLKMIDFPA